MHNNISKNTETMISEHRHIKVYHFNIKLSKDRRVTSRCNWTGRFLVYIISVL